MALAVPLDERGLRARPGPRAVARPADAPAIGAARGRKDLDSARIRVERRFDVLGALNPVNQGRARVKALAHRRRIEAEPARSPRRGRLRVDREHLEETPRPEGKTPCVRAEER